MLLLFFFNDTATTEIYTLSLHDALPILIAFGMRVKTIQKFTSDPGKLEDSVDRINRDAPNGLSTHTYDAVEDRKSTRLNLQSRLHLVCRLLLEKKKKYHSQRHHGLSHNS